MAFISIKNLDEFKEKVETQKGLSMVNFWAQWCSPCKVMDPELESLAADFKDTVTFFSVNADEGKEICLTKEIEGIPTLLFYRDGKEIDRMVGYKKADLIGDFIKSLQKKK